MFHPISFHTFHKCEISTYTWTIVTVLMYKQHLLLNDKCKLFSTIECKLNGFHLMIILIHSEPLYPYVSGIYMTNCFTSVYRVCDGSRHRKVLQLSAGMQRVCGKLAPAKVEVCQMSRARTRADPYGVVRQLVGRAAPVVLAWNPGPRRSGTSGTSGTRGWQWRRSAARLNVVWFSVYCFMY